jgi:hypothetical protein
MKRGLLSIAIIALPVVLVGGMLLGLETFGRPFGWALLAVIGTIDVALLGYLVWTFAGLLLHEDV